MHTHLNQTTRDSYISSLAVDTVSVRPEHSEAKSKVPGPALTCSSTSPLARRRSERTGVSFSQKVSLCANVLCFDLVTRIFTGILGSLLLALTLASSPAWAVGGGGGSPDPSDLPLLKALSIQVAKINERLALVLSGGGSPDPGAQLNTLAKRLARVDEHLTLVLAGGGSPDPSQQSLVNELLNIRAQSVAIVGRVNSALAAIGGGSPDPGAQPIVDALVRIRATALMLIARIDCLFGACPVPLPSPPLPDL